MRRQLVTVSRRSKARAAVEFRLAKNRSLGADSLIGSVAASILRACRTPTSKSKRPHNGKDGHDATHSPWHLGGTQNGQFGQNHQSECQRPNAAGDVVRFAELWTVPVLMGRPVREHTGA